MSNDLLDSDVILNEGVKEYEALLESGSVVTVSLLVYLSVLSQNYNSELTTRNLLHSCSVYCYIFIFSVKFRVIKVIQYGGGVKVLTFEPTLRNIKTFKRAFHKPP